MKRFLSVFFCLLMTLALPAEQAKRVYITLDVSGSMSGNAEVTQATIATIGKKYAYDLVRCGDIHSIRVGHRFRIPKEAVVEYISTPQD